MTRRPGKVAEMRTDTVKERPLIIMGISTVMVALWMRGVLREAPPLIVELID